ncbi:MAG: DUF1592 domain-containing protein [Proteobacteria bacterium]|nr:DUF1592 domain-containing protein [Pseudomonadota bacterium]
MLLLFRSSLAKVSLVTLGLLAVSGCNVWSTFHGSQRSAPPGHPPQVDTPPAVSPADPINKVPVDAEGSCGAAPADSFAFDMRPLSNTEYDLTIKDLLSTTATASAAFPPDATGIGFDTGAAHTITTTLAQSYLDASQSLAAAFVDSSKVACADQAFATSCSGSAVTAFAELAFRRPLLAGEAARLSALPQQFTIAGMADKDAYTAALATVLLAPQFLYRSKVNGDAGIPHSDQYALASKLSYALWSTMPDATLLAQAKAGRLSDQEVLAGEIDRMVSSPKARGFLRNFTAQWLGIKGLAQAPAAGHLDAGIAADFSEETLDFVSDFLDQNRNIRDLLDARFTYANARLTKHYGLPTIAGDELVRTTVQSDQRGGLLTQGSFLLSTSNPDLTSPVKRGKWVLDRILCTPPPPPPAGVQTVLAPTTGAALPMRQRLATHRAATACAGCHKMMDPIGLAFENYDYIGQWRDKDDYGPIDASGTTMAGAHFNNAAGIAAVLKSDPAFPRCVASKLATYALGRVPTQREQCLIKKIATRTSDQQYGMRNLLVDLTRALLVN